MNDCKLSLFPDTSVFLTVAVDLVLFGIQEPVRFILETKAKIYPSSEKFWNLSRKGCMEQFFVTLKQVCAYGDMQCLSHSVIVYRHCFSRSGLALFLIFRYYCYCIITGFLVHIMFTSIVQQYWVCEREDSLLTHLQITTEGGSI